VYVFTLAAGGFGNGGGVGGGGGTGGGRGGLLASPGGGVVIFDDLRLREVVVWVADMLMPRLGE